MALLNLLSVFIIFTLSFFALGKNVAPAAVKREPLQEKPWSLPRNKAPSMKVTGRVSRGLEKVDSNSPEPVPVPQVSQDHIFYDSYQANFSWSDPMLLAALGIRQASPELSSRDDTLVKRTPGSAPGDPLVKLPSCLGCIEASNGQTVTLADLTTEYLENQILLKPDSVLQDRCVFYTSVPNPATALVALSLADLAEYYDRVALGGVDRHSGLSLIATKWACSTNKVTIWNFYSGANDVSGGRDVPSRRNYWEVYVPGSWLNFLLVGNQQFTYFENMSEAMARHCGGVVYVMSMRPKQMYKYQFIWGKKEYPQLLARYSAGRGGAPTRLISVNAANPSEQYYLDWNTQKFTGQVSRRDPNFLDVDESMLHGRDTCTTNVDYEVPGEDWFG